MGWSTTYLGNQSVKDFLDKEFAHENNYVQVSIVQSRMVGSEYYAACRTRMKETGISTIMALVVLTKKSKDGYISWKDMDESMEPYYYKCPASILNLLTPLDQWTDLSIYEREAVQRWRRECQNYIVKQKNRPKEGDIITFTNPITFTDGHVCDSFMLKKYSSMTGKRNRMAYISLDNLVVYHISRLSTRTFTVKKK